MLELNVKAMESLLFPARKQMRMVPESDGSGAGGPAVAAGQETCDPRALPVSPALSPDISTMLQPEHPAPSGDRPDRVFAQASAPPVLQVQRQRPFLRRYAVPLGLGTLAAAAASLAAVFLAGAQGWQDAPGAAYRGNGTRPLAPTPVRGPVAPTVAAAPAPAIAPPPALRRRALRPAATPVLASASLGTTTAPDAPAIVVPLEDVAMAGGGTGVPGAGADSPIEQFGPAEAREPERRAARRAAGEGGSVFPAAMGLRPIPVSTGPR